MPRNKGIKYYRIRISDEEALLLRQAINAFLNYYIEHWAKPEAKEILSRIYARLTHLKPGPPKGIRIYKKS